MDYRINWKWIYYHVWPILLLTRLGIIWVVGTLLIFLEMDILGYTSASAGFAASALLFILPSCFLALMSALQVFGEIRSLPAHQRSIVI